MPSWRVLAVGLSVSETARRLSSSRRTADRRPCRQHVKALAVATPAEAVVWRFSSVVWDYCPGDGRTLSRRPCPRATP